MQIVSTLKRPAAVVALLVLAWVGWGYIRAPLSRLGSLLRSVSISDNRSNVKLTPALACIGIGPDGAPMGVADSFSEAQLNSPGVGVFLTYSGAVPQKDTFQIRWTIGETVTESNPLKFEKNADILYVKFPGNSLTGVHKIEFLVGGIVQQTKSVEILPAAAQSAPRRLPPRKRGQPALSQDTGPQPGEPQPSSLPPPLLAPAQPVQTGEPSQGFEVIQPIVYRARHWHTFTGSCTGELTLTPQKIEFSSKVHTVHFEIKDAAVDNNGIRNSDGKPWNFYIAGVDVAQLLQRWQRGDLFASSPREPATPAATQAQPLPAKSVPGPRSSPLTFKARHKHFLGSCSGVLTLTPEMITFSSQEHPFTIQVNQAQVEGEGVRDRNGKLYNLEIPGEDVGELLRSWKRGQLFQEKGPAGMTK